MLPVSQTFEFYRKCFLTVPPAAVSCAVIGSRRLGEAEVRCLNSYLFDDEHLIARKKYC